VERSAVFVFRLARILIETCIEKRDSDLFFDTRVRFHA
jgi:hypothetical protein